MRYNKIQENDPILLLDTDFSKKHCTIDGFCFDDIRGFEIHAIPFKSELNGRDEAKFNNIPMDTIYFVQGKNKLNDFAYQLHKAISNDLKVGHDDNGMKVYRLDYHFTRKGRTSERMHGYVVADKLIDLCNALYSKRIEKQV